MTCTFKTKPMSRRSPEPVAVSAPSSDHYDCEASGLGGLPIEIGWAFAEIATGEIRSESQLIKPLPRSHFSVSSAQGASTAAGDGERADAQRAHVAEGHGRAGRGGLNCESRKQIGNR
jgi:hypothetical protein